MGSKLKTDICNELIAKNKVKPFYVINHSYTDNGVRDIEKIIITKNGIMPTITTRPDILGVVERKDMEQLRIRKLTPLECLKLQGFSEEDYNAIKERFSDSAIYHVAGDSISVSTLMCGVFGTMTNIDYRKATQDYIETLKGDYE